MMFSASEVGLAALAALVFGLTIGFRWSDRLWTKRRDKAAGVTP